MDDLYYAFSGRCGSLIIHTQCHWTLCSHMVLMISTGKVDCYYDGFEFNRGIAAILGCLHQVRVTHTHTHPHTHTHTHARTHARTHTHAHTHAHTHTHTSCTGIHFSLNFSDQPVSGTAQTMAACKGTIGPLMATNCPRCCHRESQAEQLSAVSNHSSFQ